PAASTRRHVYPSVITCPRRREMRGTHRAHGDISATNLHQGKPAMSNQKDPFVSIDTNELEKVAGGAARVASSGSSNGTNDQLMQMLTSIGDSIKDLAKNNNSGGGDQMTTMLMMMMMMGGMGGGGGGGGGFAA